MFKHLKQCWRAKKYIQPKGECRSNCWAFQSCIIPVSSAIHDPFSVNFAIQRELHVVFPFKTKISYFPHAFPVPLYGSLRHSSIERSLKEQLVQQVKSRSSPGSNRKLQYNRLILPDNYFCQLNLSSKMLKSSCVCRLRHLLPTDLHWNILLDSHNNRQQSSAKEYALLWGVLSLLLDISYQDRKYFSYNLA